MTVEAERHNEFGDRTRATRVLPPAVNSSLGMKLLPGVLSVTAGSVDVIGFLGLGGLFTSHITGNLVVLAAHLANGEAARLAPMLSVPVFMLVLMLVRLLASILEAAAIASLRPFLLLQFLLLAGFLALCASQGSDIDPNAPFAVAAGMLGVAAMAVQNALVQISLKGGAIHGGDDKQRHTFHCGYRHGVVWTRQQRRGLCLRSGKTHLAGDRWFCRWLCRGCGVRSGVRSLVADATRRLRVACSRADDPG